MNKQENYPQYLPICKEMLRIYTSEGVKYFYIEIAQTPLEHEKGLMFREALPHDRAMLFVFKDKILRYMWMKNTPANLDILFINGEGRIGHIIENATAYSLEILPSIIQTRYIIEMAAGRVSHEKISINDKVAHPIFEF